MKRYGLRDLRQIFDHAGINATSIEGLQLDIMHKEDLRKWGKSAKNDATQGEFDLFAYTGKVVWFTEWTSSNRIDTYDFDNFKSKVQLLHEDRALLNSAFSKISQRVGETIPVEPAAARVIGLYVNPLFTQVQCKTIGGRIAEKDRQLMFVWDCDIFEYFKVISKVLRKYARYDIFTFFHVPPDEVCTPEEVAKNNSKTTFEVIEIKKGVFGYPTYTFKITPKRLLERCYVLRNEGWRSDSFQRMVSSTKLHAIRNYIVDTKNTSFANNIIIGPSAADERVEIKPQENGGITRIDLPWRYNSFCIIDGQHRLLAFTQDFLGKGNPAEEQKDKTIGKLAEESELLVTLVQFTGERREILREQTRLFRDINSLQSRVKTDFIFSLQEIIEPHDKLSIGNKVIRYLNELENGVLEGKFQMKSLPSYRGKIRRSSVVQYGLAELVDLKGDFLAKAYRKHVDCSTDDDQLQRYVIFCGRKLNSYFKSIKKVFEQKTDRSIWDKWSKSGYMLLSTSAIVGFLRLYRHFLKDDLYLNSKAVEERLQCIKVSFAKDEYIYTSSQWAKLEVEMFDQIRTKFTDFGYDSLVRRAKVLPKAQRKA